RVTVVGVGPGDPGLLTVKAKDLLERAQVVVGFETVIAGVRRWISGRLSRYVTPTRKSAWMIAP
ncbi:MAG: hypothetical protein HY682_02720, partial [Chloroflexi bacterium]|nr:hypothetical protein [Chloroflexota bacterium]